MARKGFTLIEILLVIFVMVLLATSATVSFSNSAKTFDYFGQVKELTMKLREAKGFAESNREFANCEEPELAVLADSFSLRISNDRYEVLEGGCVVGEVDLREFGYWMEVVGEGDLATELQVPVDLSYERGTGVFRAFEDGVLISKAEHVYLRLRFFDLENDLERYVVIFQLSGLPEVFETLPDL